MGFLDDLVKRITGTIRILVAFLFFVFTAGMLFGLFISQFDPVFLFVPPLLGLLAFYNEKFALIAFALFIIFLI